MSAINKFVKSVALATALVVGSLLGGQSAQASTLSFVLSGNDHYSWLLDSNPTPSGSQASGWFWVSGGPSTNLTFYVLATLGGGLSAGTGTWDADGTNIFDLRGPQLFTGDVSTLSTPQFLTGTFALTGVADSISNGHLDTLTISPTPLPSTWLMLLGGLAGFAFFAYRGTKKGSAAFAAA